METFLELLKIILSIGIFALIAVFLILLPLPNSRLRSLVLEIRD